MKRVPSTVSRKAFTLIELVLVMALIAILAALLLPAIEKARSRARRAQCISQLQQIGVAFHSFAHDHGDQFPPQVSVKDGGALEFAIEGHALQEFHFVYRIYRALSNDLIEPKVLICPSDRDPGRSVAPSFATLTNFNISYFAAFRATPGDANSWLAGDSFWHLGYSRISPSDGTSHGTGWSYRHERLINVVFGDGHVESLRSTQLLARATSPQFLLNPVPPPIDGGDVELSDGSGTSGNETAAGGDAGGASGRGSGSGRSKSGGASSSGFSALQSFFQSPGAPQNTAPQSSSSTPALSTRVPMTPPSSDTPFLTANPVPTNSVTKVPTNRVVPVLAATTVKRAPEDLSVPELAASANVPTVPEPAERSFNWLLLMLLVLVAAALFGAVLERRRRHRLPAASAT